MSLSPLAEDIRARIALTLEAMGQPLDPASIVVERPRSAAHGHYATNVALTLAKQAGENPRTLAGRLAESLATRGDLRVETAGPGFLNFTLEPPAFHRCLVPILEDARAFTRSHAPGLDATGRRQRVLVEFVSANPTGPLNVVSARAAAVGDTLCRLLEAAGFEAGREFYVNDHGNQADLLGKSVLAFLEAQEAGKERPDSLPEEGYGGEYVGVLARAAGPRLRAITALDPGGRDDVLVHAMRASGPGLFGRAEQLAGERRAVLALSSDGLAFLLREFALDTIVESQAADLATFGVHFERWFRESELHAAGAPAAVLQRLRDGGHIVERDGATWFQSTAWGDDQDRVVVKSGGSPTYLLADIAYHADKRARGFDRAIDLWGPDHHGHIARLAGATEALGAPRGWLEILLVQQVNLLREGGVVKMSKRRGEFVTLRDVIDEVGIDVARWFFLMRRCESHLDFDLDLAKKQSDENPVYYVQYAHARITGLFTHAREMGFELPAAAITPADLAPLREPEALELIRVLQEIRVTVVSAALAREPHRLTSYLTEVATAFHAFYHRHQIVAPDDRQTTVARLALCRGTQLVIREALALLGVSAPERM